MTDTREQIVVMQELINAQDALLLSYGIGDNDRTEAARRALAYLAERDRAAADFSRYVTPLMEGKDE